MTNQLNDRMVTVYAKLVESAFAELEKNISAREIEGLAIFLTRTMGTESRDYHRPQHSLDVATNLPALALLAGLFHDIVYVQVDPSWQLTLRNLLGPFKISAELRINIAEALASSTDKWDKIAAIIFGFENEKDLPPFRGLNEFLSALVMTKKIGPYLSDVEMIKAIACVESTIPFRKEDESGLGPAKRLSKRLKLATQAAGIAELSEAELKATIDCCRKIVERDLSSFGSETSAAYLTDTWRVIFENNVSMRNTFFSVSEYRRAIYNSYNFLSGLHPSLLFWQEEGKEKNRHLIRATHNLTVGAEYLRAQITGVTLVEAIALETGGDAPWEIFAGSVKRGRDHEFHPLVPETFLALKKTLGDEKSEIRQEVYELLIAGREQHSRFDRKDAPLAAYIYGHLNQKKFEDLWANIRLFIDGKLPAVDLLSTLSPEVMQPLLEAVGRVAETRQDEVFSLREKLAPKEAA